MNALENKTIELAIKDLQDAVGEIENIRHRLDFLTDEKCDVKNTVRKLKEDCNKVVDNKLHSVNEWLWALEGNTK